MIVMADNKATGCYLRIRVTDLVWENRKTKVVKL